MNGLKIRLALLGTLLVLPARGLAGELLCAETKPARTDGSTVSSKTDPEPGPIKGKVEDGIWQAIRWHEKSVEARSGKELGRIRERAKDDVSERDIREIEPPERGGP